MEKPIENILEERIVRKYLYDKNVSIDIMKPCAIFDFKIKDNMTIKELKELEERIVKELSFYNDIKVRYYFNKNYICFECDKSNFVTHTIYCVEDEIIFHTKEKYEEFIHQTNV